MSKPKRELKKIPTLKSEDSPLHFPFPASSQAASTAPPSTHPERAAATGPAQPRWHAALIALGRFRAAGLITLFSLVTSVVLTTLLVSVFGISAPMRAVVITIGAIVPVCIAPLASAYCLSLMQQLQDASAQSAQQQAQLRSLLEHVPVGIARLDPAGHVVAANPRFLQLLATPDAAAIPSWAHIFAEEEQHTQLQQILASGREHANKRWIWCDAQGEHHQVRVSLVPLPEGTDFPGAVLLVEDVSEALALEAQLLRAQKMQLVGRLAGGIAHDFNNLLTVVRANVSALGGADAAPELEAIDDAAGRGARLARRLLTISRSDLLMPAPQQFGPLLFETIELVRRVVPTRIRIEAQAEIPAVIVELDHDAVQQALLNLALNARDAIAGDGVMRFEARETRAHDGRRALVVTVADDGDGMPPDVLARAIEPFFSTKPTDQASGLGLSVVFATMERLGGRVELQSSSGGGTRAELWFPIVSDAAATLPQSSAATPAPPERMVARVLLVEDEHDVRVATERVLRRLGHVVASAASAEAAHRFLAEEGRFDLVVSDVMMPGGTGVDLLRETRRSGIAVPFLFVSGYALESLDGVLQSDPRTDRLTKPWTLTELQQKVERLLLLTDCANGRVG